VHRRDDHGTPRYSELTCDDPSQPSIFVWDNRHVYFFNDLPVPEPLGKTNFVMNFGEIMKNTGIDVDMIFKIFDFDLDGVISNTDLMYFKFNFS
jgi:hypothetical protein